MLASVGNILKVLALRYIDTTIYFPLFKMLSPALAVIFGIAIFGENHSWYEWLGISIGLLVPLLLINKIENMRQNNLQLGMAMILLTAGTSSIAATLNKGAVDAEVGVFAALLFASLGIFIGAICALTVQVGIPKIYKKVVNFSSKELIIAAVIRSTTITISLGLVLYAFGNGGSLGVVQTIHSFYILIPIILAIAFYKEHWNWQKAIAILLSVASIVLLG